MSRLLSAQEPKIDWGQVDRALHDVRPEYKQQKFDSLSHVVEILSSIDPQRELDQLKDRLITVEKQVDRVVEGYHNGFNKAIQNYSRILRLFADSKAHVEHVKRTLEDAQRHSGTQTRNLQTLWTRNIIHSDAMAMLSDIQGMVHVPERVDAATKRSEWDTVVELLLGACSKLAHPDFANIGALSKLKTEMSSRAQATELNMVDDLLRQVFEVEVALDAGAPGGGVQLLPGGATPAQGSPNPGSPTQAGVGGRGGRHGITPSMGPVSTARHGHSMSMFSMAGSRGGAAAAGTSTAPGTPTAPREGGGASQFATAQGSERIQAIVTCLARMGPGALQLAKNGLWTRAGTEIRTLVMRVLKVCGSDLGVRDAGELSEVEDETDELLSAAQRLSAVLFDTLEAALGGLSTAVWGMAAAAAAPHSGTQALQRQLQHVDTSIYEPAHPSAGDSGAGYATAMSHRAWGLVQHEVLCVLSELLASKLTVHKSAKAAESDAKPPAAVQKSWLGRLVGSDDAQALGRMRDSRMEFSLGMELEEEPLAVRAAPGTALPDAGVDYPTAVRRALRGQAGNVYVTPAIYQLVMAFTDAATRALCRGAEGADEAAAATAAAFGAQTDKALHMRVETFVTERFLPLVWVDFRSRCTAALEDPDAFKLHAQMRAHEEGKRRGASTGRPVLPAAFAAENMVGDVFGWAAGMPFFYAQLTGVTENVVGRVLDEFSTRVLAITSTCLSGRLATGRPDLATAMAYEPAAALIAVPVAFYVPKSGEAFDPAAFVAQFHTGGLASGGQAMELEVLLTLLRERPILPDAILGLDGGGRLLELAALADSLDYIADALMRIASHDEAGEGEDTPHSPRSVTSGGSSSQLHLRSASGLSHTEEGSAAFKHTIKNAALLHWVDRYQALSGTCARTLRLDSLVLCVHHASALATKSFVLDSGDAQDIDATISTLLRHSARGEDACEPHMAAATARYAFGAVPATAAKLCMWMLPEMGAVNAAGVARLLRLVNMLQSAVAAKMTASDSAPLFEEVRSYFTLLGGGPEEVAEAAAANPDLFSPSEWRALLSVQVVDRVVTEEHKRLLEKCLTAGRPAAVLGKTGSATEPGRFGLFRK